MVAVKWLKLAVLGVCLFGWTGCAVPQPRGKGVYTYVTEPTTKAGYHLYLPMDYVRSNGRHPNPKMKAWPLVMTFHGMKPYDNALPQEREWEREADTYGYIVCAPELHTSDSFMEYPLTREHSYVVKDRENVIAIMEDVFRTTNADRKKVLSTSWSCGGYLAHYFPNRFPDRFACIATRLSNFSAPLMTDATVPLYKDRVPVAIFIGDGDFAACRSESQEAVAWYEARGFKVRGKMIDNMGHSRIPQTAAAFFAEHLGLEPLHPEEAAKSVAQVQMTDYFPSQTMLAQFAPPAGLGRPPSTALARREPASPQGGGSSASTRPPVPPRTTTSPPPARTEDASPQVAFTGSTAGRNYPAGRTPQVETVAARSPGATGQRPSSPQDASPGASQPQRQEPPPQLAQRPASPPKQTSPPSAPIASAARNDSATANKSPDGAKPVETVASRDAARDSGRAAPSTPASSSGKTADAGNADQAPAPQPRPWKATEPLKTTYAAQPVDRTSQARAASPTQSDAGRFTAGRGGDARFVSESPRGGEAGRYGPAPSPGQLPGRSAERPASPASASHAVARPGRVNRVTVRLNGPNVGTSPHYVEYSVDLPREKLDGADFLWMDNGVWMDDLPNGKQILRQPGRHNLSVIVVTRDDVEYRGSAWVDVLERDTVAGSAY